MNASQLGMFEEEGPPSPYRFTLDRRWARDGDQLLFVMLNPSTADARRDDPTIRRCIGFAKREGFAALQVVNLFALRATKPEALLGARDPVGNPMADARLAQAAEECDKVLVAWGGWGDRFPERVATVGEILRGHHEALWCLGTTSSGQPRHPLYVHGEAPLVRWGWQE